MTREMGWCAWMSEAIHTRRISRQAKGRTWLMTREMRAMCSTALSKSTRFIGWRWVRERPRGRGEVGEGAAQGEV